jgi:hypothetical protein
MLGQLGDDAVRSGAWHDDFLILGSRLRSIYGDELELNEDAPAYAIPYTAEIAVSVTCPVDVERADRVRAACPVLALADAGAGVFEFALRENAKLPLARLLLEDGWLAVDYELPFVAAGIPALRTAVSVVGWAASCLQRELAAAYLSSAG